MARPAHPQRVSELAERLQRYFDEDGTPILVQVRFLGNQGLYIGVSRPETPKIGLTFHADQLDNGAAGFQTSALEQIRALVAQEPYVPTPSNQKLDYGDVMSLSGSQTPVQEAPFD